MVLKRQLSDREERVIARESKQRLAFANVGRDLITGFPTQELLNNLEPLLRSVVRDEVEHIMVRFHHQSSRSSLNQIASSQARPLQLHFVNKIPYTLFTNNKVESEYETPIQVIIRDSVSKKIVTSGPLSSIKIEILVLDGDFGSDDQEDWTENEFKANVVKEREGKKPLVIGDLKVTLKDGVGYVGEVFFTDNSSWRRSRKFRLGARIVQGTCDGERIREAKSEAFIVKDHRGESYKKHHPPTMEDEIWRLEKIAKDGAFHKRLASNNITTVGYFTRLYHSDPTFLRNVLGSNISKRTWDTIMEHATECVPDEKLYAYCKDTGISLVFNSIFKVVGVIFDDQNYQSLDKLSDLQMGLVKNLKAQAYKNVNTWVVLDDLSVFAPAMPSSSLQADPYSSPSSGINQVNFSGVQQDQLEMQSVPNYTTQSSYAYANDVQEDSLTGTNFLVGSLSTTEDNNGFPFCDSPWQMSDLFSGFNNGTNGIFSPNFSVYSKSGTPRARWRMIKAALTWGISVRRDVAAKRMANRFYPARVGYSF